MNAYEQLQDEVAYGWRNRAGRCAAYIFRPISPIGCVIKLLSLFYSKSLDRTTLIVCEDEIDAKELRKIVNNTYITVLSKPYFIKAETYKYDLFISIGIENINELEKIVNNKNIKYYLFIFDNKIVGHKSTIAKENLTSFINITVQPSQIIEDYINLPVKDKHIGVGLNAKSRLDYDNHTKYINASMKIFGSLEVIDRCRIGDKIMNYSANHVCNIVASNNGWNEELNTSTPFGKEIDDIYNPNVLHERALNVYNIMKTRKDLVCDAEEKINKIVEIVNDNPHKKILIVSHSGKLANEITKHLNVDRVICGNYHNCIEDTVQLKADGTPVLIKSGERKGEPKVIGWKKQSTLAMNDFNDDKINVLSIKATSDNDLNIKCDIVILTSPLIGNIFNVKRRFNKTIITSNPVELYTIYCKNTTEQIKLSKLEESYNYFIIADENNFYVDD